MVLIAVIVGYLLGIAPFIVPKITEFIHRKEIKEMEVVEDKTQEDILDEWFNGKKKEPNQADLFREYITGENTKGE